VAFVVGSVVASGSIVASASAVGVFSPSGVGFMTRSSSGIPFIPTTHTPIILILLLSMRMRRRESRKPRRKAVGTTANL
jgi:hypothetical protein